MLGHACTPKIKDIIPLIPITPGMATSSTVPFLFSKNNLPGCSLFRERDVQIFHCSCSPKLIWFPCPLFVNVPYVVARQSEVQIINMYVNI